jgi:hypothetical protein
LLKTEKKLSSFENDNIKITLLALHLKFLRFKIVVMKIAEAIKGGVTGATTLSLLQEALHNIDSKSPRPLLHKTGIINKLKKSGGKNSSKTNELYIKLAGELLTNAAAFGLTGLGKRKNAILNGGFLGAAAGLCSAFIINDEDNKEESKNGHGIAGTNGHYSNEDEDMKKKLLTVGLYIAGGMLAGYAIKKLDISKKKRKK